MTVRFAESEVEDVALELLEGLGHAILHGPDIAPGEPAAERASYEEVLLPERLREAIRRLNPGVPVEALDEACRKVTRTESPSLVANNRAFHFVNGVPLGVVELKNPADENATVWTAFMQLQTYEMELHSLFVLNELLVGSDGLEARIGSLTADRERFMPWRTIEGEDLAPATVPQLEVLLRGVFDNRKTERRSCRVRRVALRGLPWAPEAVEVVVERADLPTALAHLGCEQAIDDVAVRPRVALQCVASDLLRPMQKAPQ